MFNRGATFFSRANGYLRGLSPNTARLYGPTFKQQKVNYSQFKKENKVICVGGPSMQASILYAIYHSKILDVTKFVIIGKRSWVLDVHPDWDDKPWGQCKRYLPPPIREIAEVLFGSYPDNKLLNFGMVKQILLDLERRIQESGVLVINEEVFEFKETREGLFASMKNGEKVYFGDNQYRIVNAANTPGSYQDLPNNSTGLLYHSSKVDSTAPIALVGSGANLSWACRDFSQIRQVIHLVPPGDRLRDDLNNVLYCKISLDDDTKIEKLGNKMVIYGINIISGERVMVTVPEDQVYSALGHQHNFGIVTAINPKKIINVNSSPSTESLEKSLAVSSFKKGGQVASDFRGTVVPPGNMKYNFLSTLHKVGLLDLSMPNAVIAYDNWQNTLIKVAKAREIIINKEFFKTLKPLLKHSYEAHVPTPQTIIKVIEGHYLRENFPARRKNGTKLTLDEFMDLLKSEPVASEEEKNDLGKEPQQFKP
jgi:hypothetical protein